MTGDSCGKCHSETVINIIVGFAVSSLINYFVLPHFTIGISNYDILTNLIVTSIFTVSSYIRGFSIRRLFSRLGTNYTLLSFFRTIKLKLL